MTSPGPGYRELPPMSAPVVLVVVVVVAVLEQGWSDSCVHRVATITRFRLTLNTHTRAPTRLPKRRRGYTTDPCPSRCPPRGRADRGRALLAVVLVACRRSAQHARA